MVQEIIKIVPSVLWFFFVVSLVVLLYKPFRYKILPNITSFKLKGIEISLINKSMDSAIDLAEKSPEWNITVDEFDKKAAINRATQNAEVFHKVKIIWVNDEPDSCINEIEMFKNLGCFSKTVINSEDAINMITHDNFDIVISDIQRKNGDIDGIRFLQNLRVQDKTIPVIFYVGSINKEKPIPIGSFGITNRPDELLHLVLDILERKAY